MSHARMLAVLSVVNLACMGHVMAGEWPQWRGPFMNGSSEETNLPATWTATENVAWSVTLPGPGSATPVIAENRVYISSMDRRSDDLWGLCFDVQTGAQVWRKKLGASDRKVPRNNLASPSPVTDGRHVYFLYGSGHVAGLTREGELMWSWNLEETHGNISMKYGYSSSPLLHDNILYVLVQRRHTAYRVPHGAGLESFILAIDGTSGETLWKHTRVTHAQEESLDAYSSPVLYDHQGRLEMLVMGASTVTSHDLKTGSELWRYQVPVKRRGKDRTVPSPVSHEGLVFVVPSRGAQG
ncbi:MAG: PQQ-binding-like beta-propeller repeat protein, partial [Phycisphaeraceae bacterium]|nr:PQQ-binding-like beta-propeller repeat protein [Phycisphaeraceae bacterium]